MVNTQELNNSISELEVEVEKFRSISDIFSDLNIMKTELKEIMSECSSSSKNISSIISKLDNKLSIYETLFQNLLKDNKTFYKELEDNVNSRLSKYNSDIQVVIRDSANQMQKSLEIELTQNFNKIQSEQKEILLKQNKQFLFLKILMIISIIFCIAIGILVFIK